MRFLLQRLALHSVVFALIYATAFLWTDRNVMSVTMIILALFSVINLAGEVAYLFALRTRDKDALFKILVIRTIKFLLYLTMTIPFVWFANEQKTFFGLLIVALFFVYSLVECSFFLRKRD